MNAEDEVRAVEGVVDRLAAMYPDVSRERVVVIVNEEHLALEGNRIRDFIPVLVEHEARERLRAEGASHVPFVEASSASDAPGVAAARIGESSTEPALGNVPLLNGDLGGGPA